MGMGMGTQCRVVVNMYIELTKLDAKEAPNSFGEGVYSYGSY